MAGNTKLFYNAFRKCIIVDLRDYIRVCNTGLSQIFVDLVKNSFAGEPRTPPKDTQELLLNLISPNAIPRIIAPRTTVNWAQKWNKNTVYSGNIGTAIKCLCVCVCKGVTFLEKVWV